MDAIPFSWPVGMGRHFGGVFDIRHDHMRVFRPGSERHHDDDETVDGLDNPVLAERFQDGYAKAREEIELISGAVPEFDHDAFLAGRQTPVFFGSAINNFGVREVLDALVELAPAPGPRAALERPVQPDEPKFTGVVFKVQANMDPAHRDRVAFVRVSSGHFQRGMRLKVARNGKEIRPNNVVSFLSQRREIVEEAYAGDIIGIPNHGILQLGDVLTEGESLTFTGLPFFAPELFQAVEVKDPLRTKQLRTGLTQLGEEGAIQVFRPEAAGGALLLGAVGQLQFEVVAHRLKTEYGVDARLMPSRFSLARWITSTDAKAMKKFMDANGANIAHDVVDAVAFLATSPAQLRVAQERYPEIEFHAMREHAGRVFGSGV
jgi:peptide chain release factor 3